MAVAIRLARYGRKHTLFYRVVALDKRRQREGKAVEVLGTYDPFAKEKNISVDIDRVHAWIRLGAQCSDSVASLLKFSGYTVLPEDVTERRAAQTVKRKAKKAKAAKKDGKKWSAPSKRVCESQARQETQSRAHGPSRCCLGCP